MLPNQEGVKAEDAPVEPALAMENPLRALRAEANGVVQHAEQVGHPEGASAHPPVMPQSMCKPRVVNLHHGGAPPAPLHAQSKVVIKRVCRP